MAKRVVAQVFDDLDGAPVIDGRPMRFGIDGRAYEIDLTEKNSERFREILAPYIRSARRITSSRKA